MQYVTVFTTLTIVLFFSLSIGCSPSREDKQKPKPKSNQTAAVSSKIDGKKFENVYRAFKQIQGSIAVGVSYVAFIKLLQDVATEISIAKDKVESKSEKELLEIYIDVLDTYRDSAVLWEFKIRGPKYLDVEPHIEQVFTKYHLPMESRESVPRYWNKWERSLEDSVQVLWARAHERLEKATAILLGK